MKLPEQFSLLMPYEKKEVRELIKQFFIKYYNDDAGRIYVFGINPGRLGAGTTGIAFTDPVALQEKCKISNELNKKAELSSTFIYMVIDKFGGVRKFYKSFLLTAVCPVGFIKNGKNINYYDDKDLEKNSREFILKSLNKQVKFGAKRDVAICLGEGKNFKYLQNLNNETRIFRQIIPLAHPRFIMQYERKRLDYHIGEYVRVFKKLLTTEI